VIAFGVGGMSLMGLAPSGGYIAKQFLETAMNATGQSWLGWVTMVGGLLSFVYVLRVLVAVLFKANGKAEFAPEFSAVNDLARDGIGSTKQGLDLIGTPLKERFSDLRTRHALRGMKNALH
jgi:NADH:ubiquinone oxidoreductase subunit 5 (subunit L)/multisubunit Na+/H+ antiporter MnhA subunit